MENQQLIGITDPYFHYQINQEMSTEFSQAFNVIRAMQDSTQYSNDDEKIDHLQVVTILREQKKGNQMMKMKLRIMFIVDMMRRFLINQHEYVSKTEAVFIANVG